MSIRDEIKAYIEKEIRLYLPAGCGFCFLNENKYDITAFKNPEGVEEISYNPVTEWVYPFNIQVSFSTGEQGQYSPQNFIDAMENYQNYIGKLFASEVVISVNSEHIVLKNIRSVTHTMEDMNYYINYVLEYSHYEVYDG